MIERFQQAYTRRVRNGENLIERMRTAKLASSKLEVVDRLHFLRWIMQSEKLEAFELNGVGVFSCSNYACVGIPVAFTNGNGFCGTCAEQKGISVFIPKLKLNIKKKLTYDDLVQQYGVSEPEPIKIPLIQSEKEWDTEDGKAPF